MRLRASLTLGLLATAGLGAAWAQEPLAGARAEIVRVDAVVTDADGTLVRGLAEEDFALFEDGKRQELAHFLFTGEQGGSSPATGPGGAADAGRHVVILVDDVHIARGSLGTVQETLGRVASELLTGGNRVALLTTTSPPGPYVFVEERSALLGSIEALSASDVVPPGLSTDMTPATAEMILRGDRGALVLATRRLIDDPTGSVITSGPRASVTATQGPDPAGIDPADKVAADEAERQARAVLLDALRFSSLSLSRLEGVVRGLAALPGRKVCLLVSDGFLVGDDTSLELKRGLEGVVDAATRSGTVVYALDSEGLPVTVSDAGVAGVPSRPGLQQSTARQGEVLLRKTLETVTGSTGGFLIRGANDLTAGLERMRNESRAHYVMAYTPTSKKRNGKFRKIEVKLPGGKDYVVRTRRGYLAPDDDDEAAERRAARRAALSLSDDAAWALLQTPVAESRIPIRLTAGFLDAPPLGSQVLIRANVDLRAVSFREDDSRHRGTVELLGGLFDAGGTPVGFPHRRHAALDWGDSEHEEGLVTGLAYEHALPLDPGRYEIRLLVQDVNALQTGVARQWVDVPDLTNGILAMSAVFLGSEDQSAQGVRHFERSESLSYELYVYNPFVDAEGKTDVVMQAQIWSAGQTIAASQPEPVVFEETDGAPEPQGNSFPLSSLEPGPYQLKVVVVDRKANVTLNGVTDFTVE